MSKPLDDALETAHNEFATDEQVRVTWAKHQTQPSS
jgi:hypothetical protein